MLLRSKNYVRNPLPSYVKIMIQVKGDTMLILLMRIFMNITYRNNW